MGIKPSYIKSMGTALLEQHGKSFNGNYDDNKKVVTEITTIESKMIRNRVAGYVTRKVNTTPARR
jgi:small subunit ribosomal protein S17e